MCAQDTEGEGYMGDSFKMAPLLSMVCKVVDITDASFYEMKE